MDMYQRDKVGLNLHGKILGEQEIDVQTLLSQELFCDTGHGQSLAGPSVAMHQELENVDTHVEMDDHGLKLPNGHEDKTADDHAKSKMLCEGTEIDTEMHDNEMEVKDPLLGHEEDNIDKLTAPDPKDSEDLKKNNKDSMIHEIQENHNGHITAVNEEKYKNREKPENFEGKILLKFKDQNKLKLPIVQATFDEESFYIFNNFYETSIKFKLVLMMQRNTKVFAWILIVQQTISTVCLDMHDLTFAFICKRAFYAWIHYEVNKMPDCFQTQSEQYSLKEAVATSSETSGNALQQYENFNAMCDLNSGEVTTMKNTQHDKMLTQKHRDTGQHTRTIEEIKTISSHISLKGNANEKILARPALKSQYSKEPLKSDKKLYMYMQSSNEKESLYAKNWYLKSGSDHFFLKCSNLHDFLFYAVRFGAEGIPPRPCLQLPAPALPLTRFLAEVNTVRPNFTTSSAQEQSPNQSSETENISFSSRVLVEEFPSTTSADEGNGLSLRPSNEDQKDTTSSERTTLKWNVDTNKSGSDEKIPRVHSHPVEESAESEENNRLTVPEQDTPSQQIAEAGSIFIVAAASTPGSGEIQKYLLTAAAQSVLDMGYQRIVVLRAIRRVLRNRVSEEMTGEMILETIFEIEEEKENKYPSLPSSELEQGNDITETNSLNNCPTNYTALRDNTPVYGAVGGVAAFTPGIGEMQNYLQTDAAQSVLDMGFQPTIVLRAIDRVLMNRECEELTGEMIMEAAIEEIMTIRSPSWLDQVNESTGEGEEVTEGACGEELPFDHKEMRD